MTRLNRTDRLVLALIALVILALGAGLLRIYKQPSVEALVPTDSPALTLRNKVRDVFGLKDPIVVALVSEQPRRFYAPDAMAALHAATTALQGIPQLDPDQIFSLATEQWVRSTDDDLVVAPLLPALPLPADAAAQLERALSAAPAYQGTLIAEDGSAALILAELRIGANPADTYEAVVAAMESIRLPAGLSFRVAGEATTAGFLSRYIDRDATVLTPAAAVLMLVMLGLFLRSWKGLAAGALVMLGTLVSTVGLMGWAGSPLYVITSCMPAILLCVSIADVVHYGERVVRLRAEGAVLADAISGALRDLYRPMLLTSLTTAAGFVGMALTASLPPLVDYGLFAAFGVFVAWILTIVGVPLLFRVIGAPGTRVVVPHSESRALAKLCDAIATHPRTVLGTASVIVALGIAQATQVTFNEERVRNFAEDSPVFQADRLLNQKFAGVNFLDVYLRVEPGESLMTPDRIARIDALQRWMETEGGFSATYSFVDLLRNMSSATGATEDLPTTAEAAEQYLLLYEVSGPPGDLRQEIVSDRSQAYLRGHLKTSNYLDNKPLVEALEAQLRDRFSGTGITADVAGGVHLTHSFFGPYLPSTLSGIAASALMVFLMCSLMQRSLLQGLLCIVPVAGAVLAVFGVMGTLGIWLNVATSMFASIGIGLGVDFAIHTLHSIRRGLAQGHAGPALTREVYRDIGRPLTANALILALGFSVTLLSSIPPLRSFGMLVAATVCASWLAAILILPALYALATRHRASSLGTAVTTEGAS